MYLAEKSCWWIPLIIGLFVFTGCRTYGGGTDDQMAASLRTAYQQIDAEALILQSEAEMLAETAEVYPKLVPFSERMQKIATEYAEMIKKQKKMIDQAIAFQDNVVTNWVGKDRYRTLHRAFGAVISERELKLDKRYMLSVDLGEYLGVIERKTPSEEGRLQIRPQFYNQLKRDVDFQNIIAGLESATAE